MGLLRKLARKVVDGVQAVREEAKHPGRPQGFKASTNPFYQEPEERLAHEKEKERIREEAEASRAAAEAKADPGHTPPNEATEGTPWYLKGEQADPGWDETNPGWEPGKKWEAPE